MTASAGVTTVPAPVEPNVNDVDIALMWRAVQKQRFGISNVAYLAIGIAALVPELLRLAYHAGVEWAPVLLSVTFIALAFNKSGSRETKTLRPFSVAFSDDGIALELPGSPAAMHTVRYAWRAIHSVDDVGDSLVVIPWFRQRIVLPKRSFPDRGREAWAFFAAHGVAGRLPPAPANTATA